MDLGTKSDYDIFEFGRAEDLNLFNDSARIETILHDILNNINSRVNARYEEICGRQDVFEDINYQGQDELNNSTDHSNSESNQTGRKKFSIELENEHIKKPKKSRKLKVNEVNQNNIKEIFLDAIKIIDTQFSKISNTKRTKTDINFLVLIRKIMKIPYLIFRKYYSGNLSKNADHRKLIEVCSLSFKGLIQFLDVNNSLSQQIIENSFKEYI